ncbi:MAG TPA: response regulator [Ktedonobacterales bacterium]
MSGADTDAGRICRSAQNGEHAERDEPLGTPQTQQSEPRDPYLVLIAEDEQPIAEALAMIVADAGYTPLIASQGKQALELTRAQHPALILTDLMMPLLNGAQLIAAIRADAELDNHHPPPIVLMTAGGVRRALEVNADALLKKPFEIAEVEALLGRFLGPPPLTGPDPPGE